MSEPTGKPVPGAAAPGILQIPAPQVQLTFDNADDKSSDEAQSLAAGTLDKDAAKNKHARDEKFKDHISRARTLVFWFLIASFMAMTAALIWHWVTPFCFLDQKQLDTIKTIIGAALASKVFAEQAKHMN